MVRSPMAQRKKLLYTVGSGLLCLFMTGCGGSSGGGGGSSSSPPPTPGFSLSLSPSSVTLMQGGTSEVQVSVTGQDGFTGSVSVTVSGLPSGVTVSPSSLSIAAGSDASFDLSATSSAEIVQQTVSVAGASGTLSADASFQLTVMQVAVQDPFHAIGGVLVHGFYDESRQLLFAANPGLNELERRLRSGFFHQGQGRGSSTLGNRSDGRWKDAGAGHGGGTDRHR